MKILRKLNFFLIAACLLVFTLTTAITGAVYRKVLFDNTYQTMLGALKQIEYNFSEKRSMFQETVLKLLCGEALEKLDAQQHIRSVYAYESINTFNRDVLSVLSYMEDISSIVYLNRDGVLIGTDGKTVWRENAGEQLLAIVEDIEPGISFQSGFSSELFYSNKKYLGKKHENYISAVVPYQPVQSREGKGYLIINIKEAAFRNIFSATMDKDVGNIYIVDAAGSVLSSTYEEQIGRRYRLADDIANQNDAFYMIDGEEYVIYYAMPEMGWGIVWEKPVHSFYAQADLLNRILICFVLFSLIIILLSYSIYAKMQLKPLHILVHAMEDIGKGHYGIRIEDKVDGEIGNVIESFNQMSLDIDVLTKENERINNEKRALQLLALQEQMSPHFVLNSLNTIKWMAVLAREENIVNMVIALSKIIRAFKNTNAFGTIGEEIDFIKNYILVMNYRYGDVIHVHYDVEPELEQLSIPIFFIQPLVENSLKHGFASTHCRGDIYIHISRKNDMIFIQVSDNGKGLKPQEAEELNHKLNVANQTPFFETEGVGLMNIAKRMNLYYGEKSGIKIKNNADCGIRVELRIPYQDRKETE